jgi:tRNA-2-methylthio-N6-dimethylallyladenosine synthase
MKFHIITIGCQMNKSDSERIYSYLVDLGYAYEKDPLASDLVVLTTCGVRQSAEDRIYGLIPKIKKQNPKVKIILTGCLSERKDVRKRVDKQVDLWMNIKDLPLLKNQLAGLDNLSKIGDCDYLKLRPKYLSKISAFVPIGNGCDNFCSYCVVPHARGREAYRSANEIILEVKELIKNGYKEITLIAQNVNSYYDHKAKIDFADLLVLINKQEGDFWIRFATSHPKDMSEKLIKAMADCEKLCEHLHLPAQSGDDEILKAMNRKYIISDYLKLIEKVREKIPQVAVTTDIIVGYPGESRKQFLNTKKLFKLAKFDMAYIAMYSPRPNTAAASLIDDVKKTEKKIREKELMEVLKKTALKNNKKYLKKKIPVLIEFKNSKGELIGKTRSNKIVKIIDLDNTNPAGKIKMVSITGAQDFGLSGKFI